MSLLQSSVGNASASASASVSASASGLTSHPHGQSATQKHADKEEEELGTVYIVLDQCQRLVDAAVPVAHDGGMRSLVRARARVCACIIFLQSR